MRIRSKGLEHRMGVRCFKGGGDNKNAARFYYCCYFLFVFIFYCLYGGALYLSSECFVYFDFPAQ